MAEPFRLGIVVNPMSGRDVRRVAARASTTTHHDKQQQVTRLVLAALEQGVDEIFLLDEPFRINARAVENLPARNRIRMLKLPLTHTGADTTNMMHAMWQAGCRTFIVLGGDGTSRVVATAYPDAVILPLSTGTNNVFPMMIEASVAGAAAGLVATGKISGADCARCKRIHIETDQGREIALVDAVLLRNDLLGSYLPFAADDIAALVLAIAKPDAIGMSPIGGMLIPASMGDDFGVAVTTGAPALHTLRVPISAGLYGNLAIKSAQQLPLEQTVTLTGPGIVAVDGDRILAVSAAETIRIRILRDGPRVIDPGHVMRLAVKRGLFGRLD